MSNKIRAKGEVFCFKMSPKLAKFLRFRDWLDSNLAE